MTRPVLATARARVELLPEVGGSIGRFVFDGRDVLRPTLEDATDALNVGCFPLVPFCNRIPSGRFTFQGREVALAPNLGGHPHPLHGQGWRAAWTVTGLSDTRAVLTYDHAPSDWPWAYRAEQILVLSDQGLRVELSVTNTGTEVMPAGLGLHPYFAARPGERLKMDVDGVWMVDADVLPTVHQDGPWMRDWTVGAPTATDSLIDNCWTGFGGKAVLSAPEGSSTIIEASDNCRWAHVYSPPGADFVCVEPTSSRPDPFGPGFGEGQTGIVALAPGQKASVWMTLTIA